MLDHMKGENNLSVNAIICNHTHVRYPVQATLSHDDLNPHSI